MLLFIAGGVLALGWTAAGLWSGASVEIVRIPEGGRMPRAVIDETGTVHVVFFEGVMSGGDLFYISRSPGAGTWSEPTPVNSDPRSAVGVGPIDGGQVALGVDGTLHVVWFQTNPTRIFYTRSRASVGQFEPQRTLWQEDDGSFEASPTVATDGQGNVYVFWHAGGVEDAHRAVHTVVSHDAGRTFDEVRAISQEGEGACGCCNMAALADADGTVYVSYRSAGDNVRRGQRLLVSRDEGRTFVDQSIDAWEIGACPVTTTTLSEGPESVSVAWENDGQVHYASADDLGAAVAPEGAARFRRKNPVVAVNRRGHTLLAWGDAPGLRAGGTLHWRVFDAQGRATRYQGDGATVPSGSAPTAVVRPDDSFLVLF
jgi:hypothetical protein